MDRRHIREEETRRQERAERVKKLDLDENKLTEFVQKYEKYDRETLIQEGMLSAESPQKGGNLIKERGLPLWRLLFTIPKIHQLSVS